MTFHKRMTAGKRALAASSPLDRLIPGGRAKRAREEAEDPPATKRARPEDPAVARAALQEERRARRRAKKAAAKAAAEDGGTAGDVVGVVYVGHIPHGFYEKQMRAFFGQFGEVTRLRLSRSKKTARSRGFAFVEFANAEVAGIAAKAMDGYLMHGRALATKLVAPEDVHPDTFVGANRVFNRIPWAGIERKRNTDAARNPEKLASRAAHLVKQHENMQQRLVAQGITYKFPPIPEVPSASMQDAKENVLEKETPSSKAPLDSEGDAMMDEDVAPATPMATSAAAKPKSVAKSGKKTRSAAKGKKATDDGSVGVKAAEVSKDMGAATPKAPGNSEKATAEAESSKKLDSSPAPESTEAADAMMDDDVAASTPATRAKSARKAKPSAKKTKGSPKATGPAVKDAMIDGDEKDLAPKARSASKAKATPRAKPSGKLRAKSARK